ncbi:DUF3309 family protein [Legionella donaldsonii]|uniref:DUF3309 family protein n=1 Tax=Legionella donaldsonii TaxID=45060 RepID=UPI000E1C2F78|nr:DUF3309 family protein [Legionella donaldsonii]
MHGILFVIFLVLLLIGTLPVWNYSRRWGYRVSSCIGAILIIFLVVLAIQYAVRLP